MSLATAKEKHVSNRFMLVRLGVARILVDNFVFYKTVTDDIYKVSLDVPDVYSMMEGVDTKLSVSSIDDVATHSHYYYDTENNELYFGFDGVGTPDENDGLVVYYYIYYTGEKFRYYPRDPESAANEDHLYTNHNPQMEWQPRITRYPDTGKTIKNITAGILTSSNTSINISNTDSDFNQYLSINDSFYNKPIDIWMVIDDIANIEHIYSGNTRSVRLSNSTVNISAFDPFGKFDRNTFNGDTELEARYIRSSSGYPDLDPRSNQDPIRFVYGPSSPFKLVKKNWVNANGDSIDYYLFSEGLPAVNLEYDDLVDDNAVANQGLKNRTWGACRTDYFASYDVRTLTTKNRSAFWDLFGLKYFHLHHYTSHDLKIGETVRWGTSPNYGYGVCVWNELFTYNKDSLTYNLVLQVVEDEPVPSAGTALSHRPGVIPLISTEKNELYTAMAQTDTCTTLVSTTSGGNRMLKIEFTNSFEQSADYIDAPFAGSTDYLDPKNDKVHFVFYPPAATATNHADALKALIESAGLTTNAASFTAAASALDADVQFCIPFVDESDYKSVRSYIEAILKSTFGYLTVNNDNEIEYHLLSAPSSTDSYDFNEIQASSFGIDVSYDDVVTEIVASNKHANNELNIDDSETAFVTKSSDRAKYLHGIDKSIKLEHVLARIDNRLQAILDIISERKAVYTIKAPMSAVETIPGDDIEISVDKLLGSDTSRDIKVTSIKKSTKDITITGEDLGES